MRDLNDILYFAAVVNHRGFAPAARAMALPKSSLSRHVARLEERLGVRLLERSTRHLAVTEVGQVFFHHCQAALAEVEVAEELAARAIAVPRGTVHAICPPALAAEVAGSLPCFLADYPEVRVKLRITDRRLDLVEEGVDVAIRSRLRPDADNALQMRTLGRTQQILVASPDFLARRGQPARPVELSRFPTLSLNESPGQDAWTLIGEEGRQEIVEHTPRLSCSAFGVVLQAALSGTGIALLPKGVCISALQTRQLEHVLPGWHESEALANLVFTSRRGLLPAVRAFIDFVVRTLPSAIQEPPPGASPDLSASQIPGR
jgi:DNA-binding transcriptional LysR family regulator